MECKYCQGCCIKKGKRLNGKQNYQCKACKKYQQKEYIKPRIVKEIYSGIQSLSNEGMGICSLGRYFKIAKSSVQRVIERLVNLLPKPVLTERGKSYEIDELKTFCGNKKQETWVIYAINRYTKQIVAFYIGKRTKENVNKVLKEVLALEPKRIYTDKLNIYNSLLDKKIRKVYPKCTNHIERKNLTLRMLLKRLNRKTICFTRSEGMLYNSIYLWMCGDPFVKAA